MFMPCLGARLYLIALCVGESDREKVFLFTSAHRLFLRFGAAARASFPLPRTPIDTHASDLLCDTPIMTPPPTLSPVSAPPHIAITFRAVTAPFDAPHSGGPKKLAVVGSIPELGGWHLEGGVPLAHQAGGAPSLTPSGDLVWESPPVRVPAFSFPFEYRYVANGHRSSPTSRPLAWDDAARVCTGTVADAGATDRFSFDGADAGWVTASGVGGFQVRVGVPPGSDAPLVTLEEGAGVGARGFDVALFEACPHDPAAPSGKPFAVVEDAWSGGGEAPLSPVASGRAADAAAAAVPAPGRGVTFLMNAPSLAALAFRIDVTDRASGALLARGFVPPSQLAPLEGHITAPLLSPSLSCVGTLSASFLVVTALDHPSNSLAGLQRARWTPGRGAPMLDIGHRGAGASSTSRARVAENTLLAFQAAAAVHSDYVEMDVHVTRDAEVVVHHDSDVRVAIGKSQTVTLSIASLTLAQLRSAEFEAAMRTGAQPGDRAAALGAAAADAARSLKRTLSSGEDILRTHARPTFGSPAEGDLLDGVAEDGEGKGGVPVSSPSTTKPRAPPPAASAGASRAHAVAARPPPASPWRVADRVATLRDCFRAAPPWLGWNCELKYPDAVAAAASPHVRPLGRNEFADAVLRVVMDEAGGHGPAGGSPTVGTGGGGGGSSSSARRVIFSSFDPDLCTLLALKQPRHPVFFLTNAGSASFSDPRMNGVGAALDFAAASHLQGVVAHAAGVLPRLHAIVATAHARGLHLFTWGDDNNDPIAYAAQRAAGVDGVISDDVAAHTRRDGKTASHFVGGGSVADAAGGGPPRPESRLAGLSLGDEWGRVG